MTARPILVTGAGGGIGAAVAADLARHGFEVVVHFRSNDDGAAQTLGRIRACDGSGRTLSFDVRDRAACRRVLESDIAEHGAYYGVVCNAGIHRDETFPALEDGDWDDVIDTNLTAFYNVLHPVVMPMVRARRGGRIVTISSLSGQIGNRGQVNYSAAKAGIIGATKALALELAKRRITVNSVAPGLIETGMADDDASSEIKKMIPMQRAGTPEDVAALVSFLCSDRAGYITRQVIAVNGGLA